ncbi:3-keto-steroid reductase/17-beta-hydroxysteroid dehydrogenase 7-like isoform X2 [Lineus longissimus]|uniref:3-keto-steroid reductase/17-beta-hydroxysteroid dehydrogenase 7-like isoform X2 n=1 Tax=Lineus longissimus TaxID=88925 RepID=UPI002B4DBE94
MKKTALITGANAGIGLALADRLLAANPTMTLCLACRNPGRAQACRSKLALAHPEAKIEIILVDVGEMSSVFKAVKEIKEKYNYLDYLYLNAGIMPGTTVNWSNLVKGTFSKDCFHMYSTGHGLLSQQDSDTSDGLKSIFATNLFGHFVMIKQLEDLLSRDGRSGQIIWTGSSNAKKASFEVDNIQNVNGFEPYSSSKYACDLISYKLNENLNKKAIYSHVTCPGLVMSNLTHGIMPAWFWSLIMPFLWIMRLFTSTMTLSPYNGSEALFWLSEQNPANLDPLCKYHSSVSVLGSPYTKPKKMDLDLENAEQTYKEMCAMERDFAKKYASV